MPNPVNPRQSVARQNVFSGTYKNRLDPKGRVSLPAEFRQTLCEEQATGQGMEQSKSQNKSQSKGQSKNHGDRQVEKAIYAFPSPRGGRLEALSPAHFQQICGEIENSTAMFSDEEDNLMAQIVSAARRISLDSNGRILLPKDFLDSIGLANTAVFVGFARRFVIFSESSHQRWHKERSRRSLAPLPTPPPPPN